MSFHFRKLALKDWLAYGGSHTIEFPDFQQGQNLIVIHGLNGFGKTSLLKALQFVFHGGYGREELFETWHDTAKANGEGSLEVSLEFAHGNGLCKLVRMAEFKPWGTTTAVNSSAHLWINGQEEEGQVEDKIQQMIPRDCQQFVFFDGAEITRYAQRQHDDGVREAIEQILGIPAVRNLRDDLERLIADLEKEQSESVSANNQNQQLIFEIEELEDSQRGYQNRLKTLSEKRNSVKQALEELRKEAAQIQTIEAEREQLKDKTQTLADLKDMSDSKDKAIAELLRFASVHMIDNTVKRILEDFRAKQGSVSDKAHLLQVRHVLSNVLQDLQRECQNGLSECVVKYLQGKIRHIEQAMARTTATQRGMLLQKDFLELSSLHNQLRATPSNGQELLDQKFAINERIIEIETDIKRLKEKLAGHESVQVQENFQQQEDYERQRENLSGDIRVVEEELQRVQNEIKDKRRQLDELATTTNRGRQITQTLTTTRRLHQTVSELVNELISRRRHQIEELATNIFTKITNKPVEYAGIHVKDDYTLEVYRRDGSIVDNEQLSAGEKEVLAYSFITALNLSSPDPAPFVMDTPFGHLDGGHRERLLQSLPNLQVQVFLLATDRDLPPEERNKFQHLVAEEYVIQRDQQRAKSYFEKL